MTLTPNKTTVALLFGGKSAEHEVSLQSAKNVFEAIDRQKYDPVLIGIDKTGCWHLYDSTDFVLNADDPEKISLSAPQHPVALVPGCRGRLSYLDNPAITDPTQIEIVFPILHGPMGEDGTIQGLLKLAEVPFVGAGVLGSAVGMDKDVMKRLLRGAGIPISDFFVVNADQQLPAYEEVVARVGTPFFVKPANMGSSVGVSKVESPASYTEAMQMAFKFDRKVVVEQFVDGREIECSVLGNSDPIASIAGEVIPHLDFYSYRAKYVEENGAGLVIPAQLSEDQLTAIQKTAINTFRVLECEGLGRVDLFLTSSDKIYINEINTIPGFTAISMYPKLWGESGISYTELIDRLIQLALQRYQMEKGLQTSFT